MLDDDLGRWFRSLGIDSTKPVKLVDDRQFNAIKGHFKKNPEFFLLTIELADYTVERNNHNRNICFLFELFRLKQLTFSRARNGNRAEFRAGIVDSEVSLGIFRGGECHCYWTAEGLNGFGLASWVSALCDQKMRVNSHDPGKKDGWRRLKNAVRSH